MLIIHVWLLLAGMTFLIELGHPGLFLFLAISLGALGAAGVATLSDLISLQLMGFMLSSILSFYLLKQYISTQQSSYVSNANALIGAQGYVTEKITHNNTGRVRIKSEEWIARSLRNTEFAVGSSVRVIRIDRTTLIIEPYHYT